MSNTGGNAAQSLRDTAKWLTGGVAVATAGIFAGSSLTSLGSLDPKKDFERLATACIGAFVGLFALGFVYWTATRVLTSESLTIAEVAISSDAEILRVRAALEKRFQAALPLPSRSLRDLVKAVEQALSMQKTPENADLVEQAKENHALFSNELGFQLVRLRFDYLVRTLAWAIPLALIGFGIFAWAANPPKPAPPIFSLNSASCSK